MTDSGWRHPRTPSDKPASIARGDDVYDGKLTDYSDSGAAIKLSLPTGGSRLPFDLGEEVHVRSQTLKDRDGRVVRHYDGGFALNFDGFRVNKDGA